MSHKSFKQFFNEGCGLRHSDEETYTPEQLDELRKEYKQRNWWQDLDAGLEGAHSDKWKQDPMWKDSFHNDDRIKEIEAILKLHGKLNRPAIEWPKKP
mgnify:CR=1 FL=1|tara:strand:- start:335 stop:628 length:294 start_codon:yes stop_codon:yes gene_type:complete